MNQVIWPSFKNSPYQIATQATYEKNVTVLQSFISKRLAWLDSYLNSSQWAA